jgi:hypothetical protein
MPKSSALTTNRISPALTIGASCLIQMQAPALTTYGVDDIS